MIVGVVYSGANSRRRRNGQFDVVVVPEIGDIVAQCIDTNFESIEKFTNNLTLEFLSAIEILWTRSPILGPGSRTIIQGILPSFPAQAGRSTSATRSERLPFAMFIAIRRGSSTT